MVYSTALFSVLLALIGTAHAAPAPPAAADKRFNQPHLGHTYDVPIRTLSRRMDHSDPEVRAAYIRDEGISHRMIHAARLDAETNELRKRDEDFLHAERMMRKRQEPGAVHLTNYNFDMGYAADVLVGTPPQQFLVVADSGSPDLLLFDQACDECTGHPTFNPSKSSTFSETSTTAYNRYGTGNATGVWVKDRVEMGGSFVDGQPFHLVQSGDLANFMGNEISGIMGLGPPGVAMIDARGNHMNTPPQFYQTAAANTWPQPEYGVYLERLNGNSANNVLPEQETSNEPHKSYSGVITFGGANQTLYSGEIDYMPANTTYWWQLPLESVTFNGRKIPTDNEPVVIDTGSTMNYLPPAILRSIYSTMPEAVPETTASGQPTGLYVIPCDSKFEVSFEFGGKSYSLDPSDTLRGRLPPGSMIGTTKDYCYTTLAAGSWLLGAAFMKNIYTVFRINPPQIGFAQLSQYAKERNIAASNAAGSFTGATPNSGNSGTSGGGGKGGGSSAPSGTGNSGSGAIYGVDSGSAAVLMAAGAALSFFL